MKFFLLILFFFQANNVLAKKVIVISDLDETVRMANVENKLGAALNLTKGVKPYIGLNKIFKQLKKNYINIEFFYVSNSYSFLYDAEDWLEDYDFPKGKVYQRSLTDGPTTFKRNIIESIYQNNKEGHYILFGDNVEGDVDIYTDFVQYLPSSSYEIYIRDAKLNLSPDYKIVFFQTDKELIKYFDLDYEVSEDISNLDLFDLVPRYLFKNLKKRLLNDCELHKEECHEEAEKQIEEIKNIILVSN